MPALASLPQYDLPEIRAATDAWWAGLARHLRAAGFADVPDRLTRQEQGEALWRDPALLITQTCGYPLMTELSGILVPAATPIYACEGCDGPTYRSLIVVRDDSAARELGDLRATRAAVNNPNSHSGMNILRHTVAPLARDGRFFSEIVMTGGHPLSIEAVRTGAADVAAIDCVTWALLGRHRPDALAGVRVLCRTDPAPSLPYALRADRPVEARERIWAALQAASADPMLAAARDVLRIDGFAPAGLQTYRVMLTMRDAAVARGCADLLTA